jgi:hypothetical protein
MAQNLTINGVTYNGVESIEMTNAAGEKVRFYADAVRYAEQKLTDEQKTQARANIAALGKADISLGIASDGLIYIFVDGTPVGTGIPQGQSGDVFGYVDENNTIVLNGNLADGTYTVKYEMENGSIVNVGNMVLDTNVYYSVKKNLTQCSISNNATQVIKGNSYSATITANSGYELKSVTVTMGGQAVSVSGVTINIASVTGNIVITAVAEEKVAIVNQIPISTDASNNPFNGGKGWKTGYRLSNSGGGESALDGYEVTGFIPCTKDDTIRIKNITIVDENNTNICCYDSDKQPITINGTLKGTTLHALFVNNGTESNGVYTSKLSNNSGLTSLSSVAYIRIGSTDISDKSIVTINQEIANE